MNSFKQDQTTEAFWSSGVPFGSEVRLSDKQSLDEVQSKGIARPYLSFSVSRIRRVRPLDGFLFEYFLFDLMTLDSLENLLLVAKCCDGEVAVRCYFPIDLGYGNAPTRQDLQDSFLFEDPRNAPGMILLRLRYTDLINQGVSSFAYKQPGEIQGLCTYVPLQTGLDAELITTTKEWQAENDPNPELFLIETGAGPGRRNGGLIEFYQGCTLDPNVDIEVIIRSDSGKT